MSAFKAKVGKGYIWSCILVSAGIVLVIFTVLLLNSWEAIASEGWQLFTLKWNPPGGNFGIISMLFGTLAVTFIALVLAVPLGLFTAIFISEVLPTKFRFGAKSILELLAGIPSIIYGLIGVAFFSIWIQNVFDLQTGRTILTAGILLAIMVLPTIITFCDDALQNIPKKYRESAKGLGLYKYEVIKSTLLPIAKADIFGAVLLGLGRALGETMAVMLVIGSIDKLPQPFFNWLTPGQTVTSKLGREIAETAFGSVHFSAMIFMGCILLLIVLALTVAAQYRSMQPQRLYE